MSRSESTRIYKSYISSPEWIKTRDQFKKTACEICGSTCNLTTHHLTYDNLTRETEDDLATLCWECHQTAHIHLVSEKRLKKPSRAFRTLLMRIRRGHKQRQSQHCAFIRRLYIVRHGSNNLPSFKHFFLFYRDNIQGKNPPYLNLTLL